MNQRILDCVMRKKFIVFLFIHLWINCTHITGNGRGESVSGFLTSRPPNLPMLLTPINGAINIPDTINLFWYSQFHSSEYHLEVSHQSGFHVNLISGNYKDTVFCLTGLMKSTTYYWRVHSCNVAGNSPFSSVWSFTTSSTTDIEKNKMTTPDSYALLPAYPNPFNPTTTITFHLPEEALVSVIIYNCLGQFVNKLASGLYKPGEYKVIWDGSNIEGSAITSGVYFCHFKTDNYSFAQKILLIR